METISKCQRPEATENPTEPTCEICHNRRDVMPAFEEEGYFAVLLTPHEHTGAWDILAEKLAMHYNWNASFLCKDCIRKMVARDDS